MIHYANSNPYRKYMAILCKGQILERNIHLHDLYYTQNDILKYLRVGHKNSKVQIKLWKQA